MIIRIIGEGKQCTHRKTDLRQAIDKLSHVMFYTVQFAMCRNLNQNTIGERH